MMRATVPVVLLLVVVCSPVSEGMEQRLDRSAEEIAASQSGKCQTAECWEEKMSPPTWTSTFVGMSGSDIVGRLISIGVVVAHSHLQHGDRWVACCGFCTFIALFGGMMSAVYVCWALLETDAPAPTSEVHPKAAQAETAPASSNPAAAPAPTSEPAADTDTDTLPDTPTPEGQKESSSPPPDTQAAPATEPARPRLVPPLPQFELTFSTASLIVLSIIAAWTRLTNLADPAYLIFDEVHFGKFMNGHITGEFYFDIHPPIVKIMMAWMVQAMCPWYNGEQPFRDIGEEYLPDSPVKAMRLLPALASTLQVPVTYLTCRELGATWWASTIAGAMCCFDNLLCTEGRVLTTDTCLIFFIACSLYFHVRTENSALFSRAWYGNVLGTGISLGLTMCTKWIGLNALGMVGICTAVDVVVRGHLGLDYRRLVRGKGFSFDLDDINLKDLCVRLGLLLGVPAVMYYISFYLWIITTPKWGEFGPYHMTDAFRAHLLDAPAHINKDLPKESFYTTFINFNHAMFTGNRDVGKGQKGHPWESWWFQWPLNLRGLACWSSGAKFSRELGNSFERHVYFLNNPFVNWITSACLILSILTIITPRKPKAPINNYVWKSFVLLLGYWSGLVPFIAVRRSCFIYHYLPPMQFLIVLSALVLDHLVFRYFRNYRIKLVVMLAFLAVLAWGFWFFSVMTYGTPVTKAQYEKRIWTPGWR